MDSTPTPQPPTLESVYAFLRTDEWNLLVNVLEYNIRDGRKKNLKKAIKFWNMCPEHVAIRLVHTKMNWEAIMDRLKNITEAMRELPEYIDSQRHYYIRSKCNSITETIVRIVQDFEAMDANFTKYLRDNEYDTVKMKYFRQGPNGYSRGKCVKYGTLFGGVQSLHLLSFLHRIYEVFLLPPDPDPDAYPPLRLHTWPAIAAIPEKFKYTERERPRALLIQGPDGEHTVAMPVQRDDRLEEHSMRSDSSGDEHDDSDHSDDVVRDAVRTWRIGNDSDDERDPIDRATDGRVVRLNSPENAQLTTMLRDLEQLSVL
jgi:hypothetical protein